MIFGRVQRRSFMWIGGSGSCVLPRYGTHAVPHMPAIAMAFGCNHLMSLAFEVDREYTAEVAAELAKPAAEWEPLPLLTLTAEDRAMDAAMYVVKYTSKPIKPGQAQHLLRMLDLMQSYMLQPVRQEEDAPTSGIGNVMVVLNRLGSSIAVGMSMVAFKLAGLMTFTSTAITVPLPVSAFAALALASTENALDDDDAEEGNTTTLLVEGATANTFHAVTQIDHYQLRGDVLCTLAMSPYMLFSLYELRRLPPSAFKPPRRQRAAGARRRLQLEPSSDDDTGTDSDGEAAAQQPPDRTPASTTCMGPTALARRVPFDKAHPLAKTHMLVRRKHPVYIRLLGALPPRPPIDALEGAAARKYYAFVLGTFKSYRSTPVPANMTLREAYEDWHGRILDTGDPEYARLVRHILDNIEAHHASATRRRAEADRLRRAAKARRQAAAGADANSDSGASDVEAADGGNEFEDDEAIFAAAAAGSDTEDAADADQAADDERPRVRDSAARLSQYDLSAVAPQQLYIGQTVEDMYAMASAAAMPPVDTAPADISGPHASTANARPARASDIAELKRAVRKVKAYSALDAGLPYGYSTGAPIARDPKLRFQRDADGQGMGPTYAILSRPSADGTQLQEERLTPGSLLPYIPMSPAPTIACTVQAFNLSERQAVVFVIYMSYFDSVVAGRPTPGQPPRMLVIGGPGMGKSLLVHAMLWYTFQHGRPTWLATASFAWTAALAFTTPVHRSLSTHTMFQINVTPQHTLRKNGAVKVTRPHELQPLGAR